MALARFSATVDGGLLGRFDEMWALRGYPTRSGALGELMAVAVAECGWSGSECVSGAVTVMYDHHRRSLVRRLLEIQHTFGHLVVCTQHVHLDHDNCLEVIITRGPAGDIRSFIDGLNSIKGLLTGSMIR